MKEEFHDQAYSSRLFSNAPRLIWAIILLQGGCKTSIEDLADSGSVGNDLSITDHGAESPPRADTTTKQEGSLPLFDLKLENGASDTPPSCTAINLGKPTKPIAVMNTTCGGTQKYNPSSPSCNLKQAAGYELVYSFSLGSSITALISYQSYSLIETAIYVLTSCGDLSGQTCIAGVESGSSVGLPIKLQLANNDPSDRTYLIIVDNSNMDECGNFELDIQQACDPCPNPPSKCSNGQFSKCTSDSSNCGVWSKPVSCQAGKCQDPTHCDCSTASCSLNQIQCLAGHISVCSYSANGCPDWSFINACPTGICRDSFGCMPFATCGNLDSKNDCQKLCVGSSVFCYLPDCAPASPAGSCICTNGAVNIACQPGEKACVCI